MKNYLPNFVKIIFSTIIISSLLFSCSKEKALVTKTTYIENAAVYKSVTKAEYLNATALEKRFIDQIDGAVNALDILKKNNPQQDYIAIVSIDKDPNNKLSNSILIGIAESKNTDIKADVAADPAPDGKCHICGLMSAYSCISEVEKYMEAKDQDSISATITRTADNCVDIKYH